MSSETSNPTTYCTYTAASISVLNAMQFSVYLQSYGGVSGLRCVCVLLCLCLGSVFGQQQQQPQPGGLSSGPFSLTAGNKAPTFGTSAAATTTGNYN